jgi:hypothetical protein
MANLSTLIRERNQTIKRGADKGSSGVVFFYTQTRTDGGTCQFCWNSPGTGCAVLEVWGSSGGGARMCCCSQSGVPGNSGAYSKKFIRVCSGSYICGWAGCAPEANNRCCGGRGNCSVACVFNSGNNGCARGEAGWGGFTNCTTSTAQFRCLRISCNFCSTCIGTYCGIVCNRGGPNGATPANASGGDINIQGGTSCSWHRCCCNQICMGNIQTIGISAGIFSADSVTCLQYNRNYFPTAQNQASNGMAEMGVALASLAKQYPNSYWRCWQSWSPCGCYEYLGCVYGAVGVPGTNAAPCAGVRSGGMRGGFGGVKITFYN